MATANGYAGNTPVATISGSKQPTPTARTADSQSVLKRWVGILESQHSQKRTTYFAGKEQLRSKDTVFEGKEYKLSLAFPNDYPFKPPKVKFETACFHPNVDVYGNICLDILQDKWSSAYDVRTIVLSIQSLLGEPNISSPLNTQAAQLWSNQQEYRKMVEKLNA
ncbi:hypothetical protein V6N13_098294 [Hibiscus sabdariffa]|uniref:UBC core domain-containing protein n=1 Tax=Hibiscus sabdariffa TaxID=183260 RepID=A0ABR2EDC8_9ROSI